jgi:hypothetical protein
MNVRALALIVVVSAIPALSQAPKAVEATPNTANTPVGHWVAEHPSNGGIGTWWDFRSDGTLTMHIGAMVTSPFTHTSNTLTMAPETVNGPPMHAAFRIDGDKLFLKQGDAPEVGFTREGPAPSPTDPLLGKWRPDSPAVPNPDPQAAAMQKAMLNALYVFSADGTQSVRIPFTAKEGTWDAAAHTFKFADEPLVYSFDHTGSKLVLGQPPQNKTTDTYLPDPIL